MILTIFEFLRSTTFKIILALSLVFGACYFSYNAGVNSNKVAVAKTVQVANQKVETKNDILQKAADATEQSQIVYKDRIVTQYKTIEKKVYVYQNAEAGHTVLDSEFVGLHDDAAASPGNANQASATTSGTNEATSGVKETPKVTTGEAIDVIADNYKAYYECQSEVLGWQSFYKKVQETINAK